MGFMPPEQLFNQHLSTASDLYSLGITLISLILRKSYDEVGDFIDYQFPVDRERDRAASQPRISGHT